MGTKCLKQNGIDSQSDKHSRCTLSQSQVGQKKPVDKLGSSNQIENHLQSKKIQQVNQNAPPYCLADHQINLKLLKSKQFTQSQGDLDQVQNQKQKGDKTKQFQQDKIFQTEGLPNLGNTCFLNSAIQLLFSLKAFRKKILKSNKKKGIQSIIKGVFQAIHEGSQLGIKQIYMKTLIEFLQKSQIDYKTSSQQDCLQFLLFILNNLSEQDQSYLKMFQIQYQQVCHNQRCGQKSRFSEYFLQGIYNVCPVCRKKCQIKFFSKPQCVVFLKYQKRPQNIKFKGQNQNDELNYILSGQIFYSGNNLSGHYISRRKRLLPKSQSDKERQKLYYYNDELIQQTNQYGSFIKFQIIASLYELQIKTQNIFKISQIRQSQKQNIRNTFKQRIQKAQIKNNIQSSSIYSFFQSSSKVKSNQLDQNNQNEEIVIDFFDNKEIQKLHKNQIEIEPLQLDQQQIQKQNKDQKNQRKSIFKNENNNNNSNSNGTNVLKNQKLSNQKTKKQQNARQYIEQPDEYQQKDKGKRNSEINLIDKQKQNVFLSKLQSSKLKANLANINVPLENQQKLFQKVQSRRNHNNKCTNSQHFIIKDQTQEHDFLNFENNADNRTQQKNNNQKDAYSNSLF